jgi:hypothetical protein
VSEIQLENRRYGGERGHNTGNDHQWKSRSHLMCLSALNIGIIDSLPFAPSFVRQSTQEPLAAALANCPG